VVDHVSGSVISQHVPELYRDNNGGSLPNVGFVLHDSLHFECAFTGDAGSVMNARGGCTDCICGACYAWNCAWGVDHRADILHGTVLYNEVIWMRDVWEAQLPGSIAAVLCIRDRAQCDDARTVHANFHATYGQSVTEDVPLLFYDVTDGFSPLA